MTLATESFRPKWQVGALIVGVLVALALIRLWRPSVPPSPQQQVQAARTNLVLKEGRLRLKTNTEPFTGVMVEHYPDGTLLSRSVVSNGLLEGLSEGWYTNGVQQVSEQFRAGVSHGVRQKFHLNGKLLSEARIVDGRIEGTFRRWHENGQLAEEIQMKKGQPDGESKSWNPAGELKVWARLEQGRVVERRDY